MTSVSSLDRVIKLFFSALIRNFYRHHEILTSCERATLATPTVDIAPCFVLLANRSLVGILNNNGLRHSALSYTFQLISLIGAQSIVCQIETFLAPS
jgi:hypothetical protein